MASYYVNSAAGGSNTGGDWTNAYTSFGSAVTAATASGDIIYVHQGHTEELAANTTYTFANNVNVICSNDTTNTPPQTLGSMGDTHWIGNSATSYTITLNSAYKIYCYGLTFRTGGTGGATSVIHVGAADSGHFELENCYLWDGSNSASSYIAIGNIASTINSYIKLVNCIFRFGSTSQKINLCTKTVIEGGSISSSGSIPSTLFGATGKNASFSAHGFDMRAVTGSLIASQSAVPCVFVFSSCVFGSAVTVLETQSPANKGSGIVFAYNCSAGDQHYQLAHYDAFGSTLVDTGIYADDGAQYDGTNRCSWKITSTANCSFYTPYVSPWVDCYHAGTSAITPYLEILRDGSTTAYQNDEVWGEFSYQGTSGFPLATLVNDRKGLLSSAANQDSGVGASGWTGDTGAWSGKLQSSSITPAEIGHLQARVCVGEPSITVYVDPQIRGRS